MTVRALRRIAELVDGGATVVGRRPRRVAVAGRRRRASTRGSATGSGAPAGVRRHRRPRRRRSTELGAAAVAVGRGRGPAAHRPADRGRRGGLPGQPAAGAGDRDRATASGRAARRLGPGDPSPDDAAARRTGVRLDLPALGSVFLVDGRTVDAAARAAGRRGAARRAVAADPARRARRPSCRRARGPGPTSGRRRPASPGSGTYATEVELDAASTAAPPSSTWATSATSRACGSTASTAASLGPPPWRVDVTARPAAGPQHGRDRRGERLDEPADRRGRPADRRDLRAGRRRVRRAMRLSGASGLLDRRGSAAVRLTRLGLGTGRAAGHQRR